jgi:hypothetical protein
MPDIALNLTDMKINTLKKTILKSTLTLGALVAVVAQAQTFDTPSYRGQAGTESAYWFNSFTNAHGANQATVAAPGGLALANASLTQSAAGFAPPPLIVDALTGETATIGGIYSGGVIGQFSLSYSDLAGTFADGIGNVTFQIEGSTLDPNSALLSYGANSLSPTAYTLVSGDDTDGTYEWSWNLPLSDAVSSFNITFSASDQHSFLDGAVLDIAPFNVAPAPEPSTLAVAGMGVGVFGIMARRMKRRNA